MYDVLLKKIVCSFLIISIGCSGLFCTLQKPTSVDGKFHLKFLVIDTTGIVVPPDSSHFARIPSARVRVKSTDYKISFEFFTNDQGELCIENLLADHYLISVDNQMAFGSLGDLGKIILTASGAIDVCPENQDQVDTLIVAPAILSNIVINEVYYSGVLNHGSTYWSDQFIELYNISDETFYLDGLIIARATDNAGYIGTNFVECVYAYRIPDEGNVHQIKPGEFIVIAQDAINHRAIAPLSIDLSQADYECFNQFGTDIDNPEVPNLLPINPYMPNDFMLNTKNDIVFLIKKKDKKEFIFNSEGYQLFKFSDVIDGVKYTPLPDDKYINPLIDASYAGYGILRFTGKSIERHHPATGEPGFDTNNSAFDFVSLWHPTPGYQHSGGDVVSPLF